MTLAPGTRLGPYEVLAPIGAGGMGEVYRARDSRLGRGVAIKVLPRAFAKDAERLARFEREARVLAGLAHPGIARIHGLDEAGGTRFIAMELAEGEDLAARLGRGPLPVDDALAVALRVAEALESAHERGVVHRDLKPANVKVAPDGTVKILDFGLTRAFEGDAPDPSSEVLSQSPTITRAMTTPGAILGTAAYMSPEQARGRPVDRRADIWAFGALLFEMLTGRRLFEGETVSETLAAVIKDTPRLEELPAALPPAIRRLIERCLERDLRRRLRDIGEARIILESPHAAPDLAPLARKGIPLTLTVAAACVLAALAATAAWLLKPGGGAAPLRRLDLVAQDADVSWNLAPVLSPDGSRIAYSASGRIWVRNLERLEPRAVADILDSSPLFWSPDGAFLAYHSRRKLWKVPAGEGSPIAVADVPGSGSILGGAWGPDGTILFSVWRGGLYRVSANGGTPTLILAPDPATQIDFHFPAFLPGGAILYLTHWKVDRDSAGAQRPCLNVLHGAASKSVERTEINNYSWPTYRDGHLLFLRNGIWALPFDPARARALGEPFLVEPGAASISLAKDGSLLYSPAGAEDETSQLGWLDRSGKWLGPVGSPRRALAWPTLSPDGRRVAFAAGIREEREIWIHDLPRQTDTRLTFEPGVHATPHWVDAGRVLYGTRLGSRSAITRRNADGSGTPLLLNREGSVALALDYTAMAPTRDPDRILQIIDAAGRGELRLVQVPGSGSETPPRRVIQGDPEPNVTEMWLSHDGRLLAYVDEDSGQPELFLTRFPSGDGRWQVSTDGGREPRWDRATNTLYYVAGAGPTRRSLVAAETHWEDAVPVGAQTKLFVLDKEDIVPNGLDAGYDVEPGGKRFLIARRTADVTGDRNRVILVQNWRSEFDALRRR